MRAARDFLHLSGRELLAEMARGHAVDPASLEGWAYRGVSLGLPAFVERLSWKTFEKTFHRDPATGALRGWNVRLVQRGLDAPGEPMMRGGQPLTFGHYRVVSLEGRRLPHPCGPGLLIDYGQGGNARLDVAGLLRDPIVAVNAGSSDLLLGWTYIEAGPLVLGTPSFFTLERGHKLAHVAAPPR